MKLKILFNNRPRGFYIGGEDKCWQETEFVLPDGTFSFNGVLENREWLRFVDTKGRTFAFKTSTIDSMVIE